MKSACFVLMFIFCVSEVAMSHSKGDDNMAIIGAIAGMTCSYAALSAVLMSYAVYQGVTSSVSWLTKKMIRHMSMIF